MTTRYVLVQWTSGDDEGRWTILEASYIRGFDNIKYNDDGVITDEFGSKGVVVEWREGTKPKSGWPVFDANFIRTSCRKASLEDEMKALIAGLAGQVKHLGEKRDIIPSRRAVEAEEDKVKPNKKRKTESLVQEVRSEHSNKLMERIRTARAMPSSDAEDQLRIKALQEENDKLKRDAVSLASTHHLQIKDLQETINQLMAENAKWRSLVLKDVPAMMEQMRSVLNKPSARPATSTDTLESLAASSVTLTVMPAGSLPSTSYGLTGSLASSGPTASSASGSTHSSSVVQESILVEIFPGTGVMCDARAMVKAKHSTSYSRMARALLTGVFTNDELLRSTLKGGANKRDVTSAAKDALNEDKLNAFFSVIQKKYPGTTQAVIGVVISSKITELRIAEKKLRSLQPADADDDN